MPRSNAPEALAPKEALARLKQGNDRFVAGTAEGERRWRPGLVDGQWPIATVLGCSDSRAPAEYVFDQGLGDLFVIRVAGNIIAPSLVGSVEFAAGNFGTRLVVVMGHTQCGAVGATARAFEHGGVPESAHVRSIVDRIAPHISHIYEEPGTPEEAAARFDLALRANAVASARELGYASPVLRDLVDTGRIEIVAALYDLSTGKVSFLDMTSSRRNSEPPGPVSVRVAPRGATVTPVPASVRPRTQSYTEETLAESLSSPTPLPRSR